MKYAFMFIGIVAFLFPLASPGQEQDGIRWGNIMFRPEASVRGAYDDRVVFPDPPDGTAEADFYSDVAAGLRINNLPAKVSLSARAHYGYRIHSTYTKLDDDFYRAGVAVGSEETPVQWGLSADVNKTLNYSTTYDPVSGDIPDSILTDDPNRRMLVQGNVAYDKSITDKTSIMPQYRLLHYFQEFLGGGTAEWQIHQSSLQLRHRSSDRILFTVGGYYSLQANDDEDGYVGALLFGAEGRATDKTTWQAEIGVSHADYDLSGTDQGVISHLRGIWQATERISVYIFGGNDFQPGYDSGSARWVYRLGYGLDWSILEKLRLNASILHDYQEAIGGNPSTDSTLGEARHFIDVGASYLLAEQFYATAGIRHNRDERDPDQTIVSLQLGYRY